jgi:hypothetical protein
MRAPPRRMLIASGSAAAMGIAVATAWLWSSGAESRTAWALRIDRQKIGSADDAVSVPSPNVIPDLLRPKYSPAHRAEFRVTSSQPVAIFVLATGVQIRTDSGWQPFSEEPRNEIWRLKPGIAREVSVERPLAETGQEWRAYVRYGTEMRGPPLLKVQLREAWAIRSFANWTGKAWGGGRFSGQNELFSEGFLSN